VYNTNTASMAERLTRVCGRTGPAKSYTALQTVRYLFNIYASSCITLALWRGDGLCRLVTRFGV